MSKIKNLLLPVFLVFLMVTTIVSADLVIPPNASTVISSSSSATNLNIAVFDGTTGTLIKDGGATIASLGGASKALDNLASVAINTSLLPGIAATVSLGSEALYMLKGFFDSEISFEGSTDDAFQTTFSITDPTTSDKTITFQDASGIVVMDATAVTDLEGTNLSISTGTLNWAAAFGDLSDVTITTPSVDQIPRFNGSIWVNGVPATSGAGNGILFYMDDTSIIATGADNDNELNALFKAPQGGGTVQDDIACTSGTSPVQGESFLFDTALGGSSIDAGEWVFDTYAAVDSTTAGRISSLTRNIYHVVVEESETIEITGTGTSRTATSSGGTPFVSGDAEAVNVDAGYLQTPLGLYQITAFTNGTTVEIITPSGYTNESGVAFSVWKNQFSVNSGTITSLDPSFELHSSMTVQTAIAIAATDKLAESTFAICNNTTTVSFTHNGTDSFSHFHSPLITRHNDLPGLDGGTAGENFHSTLTEYTGTGTGVFVRTTAPTLASTVSIGASGGVTGLVTLIASDNDQSTWTTNTSDAMLWAGATGGYFFDGVAVPTISSTNTFTNKRITPRVTTEASAAEPTINTDNTDMHSITALATNITSFTTNLSGTPTNGQKLIVRILDNSTGRNITWGLSFDDGGIALPTSTTADKLLQVGFIFNTVTSDWEVVAVSDENDV